MILNMKKRNVLVILIGGIAVAVGSVIGTIAWMAHILGDN